MFNKYLFKFSTNYNLPTISIASSKFNGLVIKHLELGFSIKKKLLKIVFSSTYDNIKQKSIYYILYGKQLLLSSIEDLRMEALERIAYIFNFSWNMSSMNNAMYIYWHKRITHNKMFIQKYAMQKSRIEPTSYRV